ncbi:MAG: glycosyltransferase family 39 protein [bacterium]|nr:glycosyltransferase family 39 protein [bacterium]
MKRSSLLFIAIISVGFLLRVWNLQHVPSGFFADEASIGYNAYTILTKGTDQYNIRFPVFFRSLDDYKAPIAIYSTVPFIEVFGLTEFSTRLPSAFYGLLTILFVFFIGKELGGNRLGLWSALAASTMPWLIHYDRVAFLVNVSATFFTATIYFFVKSIKEKQYLIPFFITSALTLYTYQPPKLLMPMLMVGLFLLFPQTFLKRKKQSLIGLSLFLLMSLPLFFSFSTPAGMSRFNSISIFTSEEKGIGLLQQSFSQYIEQFSPKYLFVTGERSFIKRHLTDGFTPLLPITLPFICIGIFMVFKHVRSPLSRILILWLLLYPISAALVRESPFSNRCIIGPPAFALLIGLGITTLVQLVKKKWIRLFFIIIVTGAISINTLLFTRFYFLTYPLISSDFFGWQYGPREIMQYFLAHTDEYDELYMSGEFNGGEAFITFYDPTNTCEGKCKIGDFMREPSIFFPNRKQLFSLSPEYLSLTPLGKRFLVKKTIYYPNGTVAFKIGVIVQ